MIFSTKECAWKHIKLNCLGLTFVGLRSFEFKKAVEKEHLFGAGDQPIDIQSGNITPDGSLGIMKFELDKLNAAALAAGYGDITEVPHDLISITCEFKKGPGSQINTISALGVAFTEMAVGQEQNAKFTDISLPFLAMRMIIV